MKELTDRQRCAFELRQAGKTLQEIASIMGTTREPVRQWIAGARHKLGMVPEAFDLKKHDNISKDNNNKILNNVKEIMP